MTTAKPTTVMLIGAALAFVACWFLPVVAMPDPDTLFTATPTIQVVPGWKAFWLVLGQLWAPADVEDWSDLLSMILFVSSALTNFVFAFGFAAVVFRWTALLRPLQWAVLVAGVLNLHWLFSGERLQIGYYLWVVAFFLLFAAMARRSVK